MAGNDKDDARNVIDLAEMRRKQRVLFGARAANKKGKGGGKKKPGASFWTYVQFLLLLALVAYLMRLCQGRL